MSSAFGEFSSILDDVVQITGLTQLSTDASMAIGLLAQLAIGLLRTITTTDTSVLKPPLIKFLLYYVLFPACFHRGSPVLTHYNDDPPDKV